MMILLGSLALAPMQCQGKQDPDLRRYETPGDALYDLAQRFKARGDDQAYLETLRFLVARYPSSRHAPEARQILEERGAPSVQGKN